ncbi:hypothetical protein H2204_009912 [Knufia peltigerae]|uniref:Uncharacterized protein n=1 Tax=Knufia peltigerae TaxID=1002370 RepID=A0AA38XX81_9EURO|nr:hypothetical protein H2204_009912 [Knufia peltigerae]
MEIAGAQKQEALDKFEGTWAPYDSFGAQKRPSALEKGSAHVYPLRWRNLFAELYRPGEDEIYCTDEDLFVTVKFTTTEEELVGSREAFSVKNAKYWVKVLPVYVDQLISMIAWWKSVVYEVKRALVCWWHAVEVFAE